MSHQLCLFLQLLLGLVRELWEPLVVKSIKSFTSIPNYPQNPTQVSNLDKFSTPREKGKKFGQRIRGFFTAPVNGPYMFAVSCSDECQLSLSSNDEEEKKSVIIDHPTDGARDMSSQYATLKAGKSYFIEALSIQNEWVSPLRVGVRLPNGTVSVPISKEFLRSIRGGLTDEIFYNVSKATVKDFIHTNAFPNLPSKGRAISNFDVVDFDKDAPIGHHISGYFLAPETGSFKFFGACSTGCELYLSKDESCSKRSLVLDYKSSIGESKVDASKSVQLEAGQHYFIDALQASQAGKRNSIKVGVVMPSGKSSFPIRRDLLSQFPPSKHGVIREVWTNVKGEDIRDLTSLTAYPAIPSSVRILQRFDAPFNERYNYGQRIRGQFFAPMTGDYRFVMSCDKKCELWLSNSPREEHKERILKETHVTARHQFEKYPDEQVSSPIHLDIGQLYYIEAIHKAATGLDHLSVGVTLPDGENAWPIPQKYLRLKPKEEKENHQKDPPCTFRLEDSGKSQETNPSDALEDENDEKTTAAAAEGKSQNSDDNKHVPLKIIHGYDNVHQSLSDRETGHRKETGVDNELTLDLDPETSHKMFHDLKNNQPSIEPSIELDDEMSEPTQDEIKKLHKSVNSLIKAANANGLVDDSGKLADGTNKVEGNENGKLQGELKVGQKEVEDVALEKVLSNIKDLGKVKIIRLKSNGSITNQDIVSALKAYSNNHQKKINGLTEDEMNDVSPFLSEDGLTNSMEALGSISKGEDFESQFLSRIPAEEAQRILAEFSKPKPPPKIENSDGIKVAGDSGGNLQIMEQNPFSNAIYGSHDAIGSNHISPPGVRVHQHANAVQKSASQTPLMTEGQPVAVVGNLAEINKLNSRASSLVQENYGPNTMDVAHAVGRPVDQDQQMETQSDQNSLMSRNVPINHVSDYDVLDLDLAGLKQMSKTGFTTDNNLWQSNTQPAGNFPLQMSQELESSPLVGDNLASMLTGDQEGSSMFFKRGNKVYRKNGPRGKEKKARVHKLVLKPPEERRNAVTSKRTEIAAKVGKENPNHWRKSNWHSHGNFKTISTLSKKSLSKADDLASVADYLEKLELPKSQWKADARSLIDNAKQMLKMTKKLPQQSEDNEGIIQSLVQPSEATESSRGNSIISTLLRNIANEVEGGTTPLDEYLSSVPPQGSKAERNIITKRPIRKEKINKRRLSRVLNKNELQNIDGINQI